MVQYLDPRRRLIIGRRRGRGGGGGVGAAPAVTGGGGGGGGPADSFGLPLDASDPLETLVPGTAGTGAYAGYTLALVDGFGASSLDQLLLKPAQLATGGTPATLYNNFSERDRERPFSAQTYCLAHEGYTGWKDLGDGQTQASFADLLAVNGGVLRSRHRHATAGETAIFGARTTERGPPETTIECTTSHPTWFGRWAWLGPCIIEIRYRCAPPSGYTLPPRNTPATVTDGLNPHSAGWSCHVRGGSEAQNADLGGGLRAGGENDFWEMSLNGTTNVRVSGPGASASPASATIGVRYDGAWQVVRFVLSPSGNATKLTGTAVLDDLATVVSGGTPITLDYDLQGTIGDGTGNLEEPQAFMFGSLNEDQNSAYPGKLDHTKWTGKVMDSEVSSIRVWVPTGNKVVAPVGVMHQIERIEWQTSGSVTVTLPAVASIWGAGSWTEMLRWMNGIGVNGPGRGGGTYGDYVAPMWQRTSLPYGLAQDLGARTVTLDMTKFPNSPGVMIGHLYAQDATTGIVRPYRIFLCVKPLVAIPAIPLATPSTGYSHTVPRADGGGVRYWDCGNLPNLVAANGGLTIAEKPSWLGWNAGTRTLSGTAPATLDDIDDRVIARVTNGAGDHTEQELNPVWTPRGLTGLTYALDPRDPLTVPGDNGDKVPAAYHRFGPRAASLNTTYAGRSSASEQPTIKTNGGMGGASRVLNFSGAIFDGGVGNSNPQTAFQDFVDGSNISTSGPHYFAIGFRTPTTTNQRLVQWCISSAARNWQVLSDASSNLILRYAGQGGSNVDFTLATLDTIWHVLDVLKNGSQLDAWLDGTQVITAHTITQTGSIDTNMWRFGGSQSGGVATPGWAGDIGRFIMVQGNPDATTRANVRTWIGRGHGQVV